MKSLTALLILITVAFNSNAQVYKLPELGYSYQDYAPYIDAKTMEIHHSKHHQAYVNNLNKAIAGTAMETQSLMDLMFYASFRSDLVRNNAGGHFNHTLFWDNLAPAVAQSEISPELSLAITEQFGVLDSLKVKLNQAAMGRFGSGWAWLMVTPEKKLAISTTANQDNPIMDVSKERGIPILGIDVWEHAYYLSYQNKRADYLSALWSLTNWGSVSAKYAAAIKDSLLIEIEKDSWPALKDFHKVMAQTFHPSETGNLQPLRTRSTELLTKSMLLRISIPPKSLDKKELHDALSRLEKACSSINDQVNKNAKDGVLTKAIAGAHDIFHEVQGLCHD